MIFSILGRYFFRRYAMTTMWFLLGVSGIIFLADFSETARRFSDLEGYTAVGAMVLTLLRLPQILIQTIPFIVLFVGMTVLIALNRRYELVVTRAAGISVWQFMAPFATGAFLVGLMTVLVLNPLSSWGQHQSLTLENGWRKTDSSRAAFLPWIHQMTSDSDVIIGAKTALEEGTMLIDVALFHFSPSGSIILRQDAASAKLENGYWLLNDVNETSPGEIPRHLDEVRLPTNLKPEYIQERLTQPESVAFYEISRKIEIARSYGIPTRALETQFHSLLSLPFLLVAMTMIAATVSLKFSRMNQSRSVILGGILSGFVLYVVTVLVKAFGSSGVVPPVVAVWIPVIVAMALGATILLHQEDG
ncbi:LPS export ABC transporter permease LptG [Rhizobiaceae bacterium BDR2-2]|uniref:LPS export ABC transporter permease LptG n=1 Tax=Ectorhizobium quercum TaxID=2965071 RepID=A0AAE3SWR7_9HYPH|nr:LPS export ABC transporter permease LptG [Ectorhizobium quercum]MCX8999023.1 LPS export ABC transporter permease LptG [Ectorhizobium quercum]